MAYRDLEDVEKAFGWLGDALIAYVEPLTLDALEGLASQLDDPQRAEATLSRALSEVFDGPLVRLLLARRARLRRDSLGDKAGAAADLKKLYELSPHEPTVMSDLAALLTELGEYRGMVQLFEDQILRGKDMSARAELARKVARMWEEELFDPREAADAWRRVLRMKQGDPDATAGLERAKANMLKKPEAIEPPSGVDADDAAKGSSDSQDAHPSRDATPVPSADEVGRDEVARVVRGGPDESGERIPQKTEPEPQEGSAGGSEALTRRHDPLAQTVEAEAAGMLDGAPTAAPSESVLIDLDVPVEAPEAPAELDLGDELAEIIDVELEDAAANEEPAENPQGAAKRSVPPPLPRA
jgi:hypothetical protein